MNTLIAFGPVPSRRLGRSLGINNIPPKVCSYACTYCQLGRTTRMSTERQAFYEPEAIAQDVRRQVERARNAGEAIDYLSFVPDGEPTLDRQLGRTIGLLRPLGIPIAVISNASLIDREDVQADLSQADWVSLKVDAVWKNVWTRVNRPRRDLNLDLILQGIRDFARGYQGELVTETMLVQDVNDGREHIAALAEYLGGLRMAMAYLSIPIRPPAEAHVQVPGREAIERAVDILAARVGRVECLFDYEGNAFATQGEVEQGLLRIMAVHPMRQDAVAIYLAEKGADWSVVERMLDRGQLVETMYQGSRFYRRNLR